MAAKEALTREDIQQILDNQQKTFLTALEKVTAPTAVEQEAIEQIESRRSRRDVMHAQMAKAEEEHQARKRYACSHTRHPASAGRMGGYPAPKGQGEWTTSGQAHDNGTISLICLRCNESWTWRATREELQYVNDASLLGFAPADEKRALKQCAWCSELFPQASVAEHEKSCTQRWM